MRKPRDRQSAEGHDRDGNGAEPLPHSRKAVRRRRANTPLVVSSRRVVIAEPFAESGLAVLRAAGIEVDSQIGKPRGALMEALGSADGLIVRSQTKVDRELLSAGQRLLAVARAGVGVDAIDVDAATQAGIVVLNTPSANTLATTEQAFALMLA